MRIMGLDYGSKTVGVAVSDPLFLTAQGVEIIRRDQENHLRRTFARIEELVQEYEVSEFVVGKPLHMNGEEGERVRLTREFGEKLERRTGLPVTFWDERLTSVEAEELMREAGLTRTEQKARVDMIAAQIILQDYMNAQNTDR
ncbi:MAG: Holliday junction resolvase RuvX [Lachnospiraceae bacterium]|nr:Holliday junction resolvase RuvX [Lachnospiraceae bacterium]MCR5476629.1 Holliday junction resolvase RuvX [Lachnospiraceae bacterium]